MTRSYQTPEGIEVSFDDENLVANAGLLLVSTLASKLGLDALISERVVSANHDHLSLNPNIWFLSPLSLRSQRARSELTSSIGVLSPSGSPVQSARLAGQSARRRRGTDEPTRGCIGPGSQSLASGHSTTSLTGLWSVE